MKGHVEAKRLVISRTLRHVERGKLNIGDVAKAYGNILQRCRCTGIMLVCFAKWRGLSHRRSMFQSSSRSIFTWCSGRRAGTGGGASSTCSEYYGQHYKE